jgi:hypothetical protein
VVAMTVLLCTPKILQFGHCAWKFYQITFLGRTGWEGQRTMSTLNTAAVPLLIVYLLPNGVVRVGCEPGATNDSPVVLQTKDNSQKISKPQ